MSRATCWYVATVTVDGTATMIRRRHVNSWAKRNIKPKTLRARRGQTTKHGNSAASIKPAGKGLLRRVLEDLPGATLDDIAFIMDMPLADVYAIADKPLGTMGDMDIDPAWDKLDAALTKAVGVLMGAREELNRQKRRDARARQMARERIINREKHT